MQKSTSAPAIFVIFGATGDLNWRKIMPALYNLYLDKWLPEKFAVIGTGRTKLSDTAFREKMKDGVDTFSRSGKAELKSWEAFAENLCYKSGEINDDKLYTDIKAVADKQEKEWGVSPNLIFYLAVSPVLFGDIAAMLNKHKVARKGDSSRLVIEKPFGRDLESAKALNQLLTHYFNENQLFRIDHYLGKETVQNLLAFRFANSILEPLWNRNYIEYVQISVTEGLGVGSRASYYETAGALRDMIQNHVFQLVCLMAMEPPLSFEADEVRNKKVDVLKAIRRFEHGEIKKNAVRGQYDKGWVEGKQVPAYREEEGIAADSNVETFAALKLHIENWRWRGVPFYIRSGKRMHETASRISIQFKDVPHQIFPAEALDNWRQNRLIISIQPEMSIKLQVQAKRPGLEMLLNTVNMNFDYDSSYSSKSPEAYETLLLEVLEGDQTLFMRADQVEMAWEILMPILHAWETKQSLDFPNYAADSWGPETAEALIAMDGYHWLS